MPGLLARARTWWEAPGGLREVFVMAVPLVISTVSWTIMVFMDRMFLLWYSRDAVAASMPAGALSFAVICFPLGVAAYANTFVSQYHGAGRPGRIGVAVWQAIFLGIASVPLALAVIPFAEILFRAAEHPENLIPLESTYFRILSYGSGGIVISAALSAFFSGQGKVRVVATVDSLSALVDLILDYLWIFGVAGFPEWGLAGAAWSTVVGQWLKCGIYLALFLAPRYRQTYQTITGCRWDRALFRGMVAYGTPNGVQYLFEVGAFTLFMLLVGRLGEADLAATTLAFNVNGLAFMPVFGIGLAASTLVGQNLGRNRPDIASRATWSAFVWAAGLMLIVGGAYVLCPHLLLAAHGAAGNKAEFEPLRDQIVVLLRFVAFYCLFDAMNMVFSSAIKGAGDTRFVLITTLVTSPLPVAFTWLGLARWEMGLLWCWIVITAWVVLLGVVFLYRFLQGKWRSMRVIEASDEDDQGEPAGIELMAVPALADG